MLFHYFGGFAENGQHFIQTGGIGIGAGGPFFCVLFLNDRSKVVKFFVQLVKTLDAIAFASRAGCAVVISLAVACRRCGCLRF